LVETVVEFAERGRRRREREGPSSSNVWSHAISIGFYERPSGGARPGRAEGCKKPREKESRNFIDRSYIIVG